MTGASLVVVDDNPDYRFLVRTALAGSNGLHVVAEAEDAVTAHRVVSAVRPDVVLFDIAMRDAGGQPLWASVQQAQPGMVVVLASSHPEEQPLALGRPGHVARLSRGTAPAAIERELSATVAILGRVELALRQAETTLPADPRSSSEARRFVEATLTQWDCTAVLDTVTLLVSELVTNAVIHAQSAAEVSVRLRDDHVRVDVFDRDHAGVRRRHADVDATSGRGTELVEALASAWGVEPRPGGKSVWFEVPLAGADPW